MSIRNLLNVSVLLVALVACKGKSADKPPSVESEVWSLSHDLGHALLLASAGQADKAKPMFDNVSARATKLVGVAPQPLPEPSSPTKTDLANIYDDYATDRGMMFRAAIADKLGKPRADLFELGLKSLNVAASIANTEEGTGPEKAPDRRGPLNWIAYGDPLREVAESAGVPADVIMPLVEKIKAGAPAREVQDEVNKLHDAMPKLIAEGKVGKPPAK